MKGTLISLFGGRRVSSDCGQPQSDSVGLCPELGSSFNDLKYSYRSFKEAVRSFFLSTEFIIFQKALGFANFKFFSLSIFEFLNFLIFCAIVTL